MSGFLESALEHEGYLVLVTVARTALWLAGEPEMGCDERFR